MQEMSSRGTSILIGQSLISGIFRLGNIMILVRLLLQSQMGEIAVVGIIYGFVQFLGAAGLNHAAPYFITKYKKEKQEGKIRYFVVQSLLIILIVSVFLIAPVSLVLNILISSGYLEMGLFLLVMLIGPLSSLQVYIDSYLLARFRINRLALGRIFFDAIRFGFSIILVLAGFGVFGVIVGWLIGEVSAVLIFGIAAMIDLPPTSINTSMKAVLSFSLPSLIFQLLDVIIQNADRVILLHLTNLSALGVYDILLGLLFMLSFFALAVSTSVYPYLANAIVQDDDELEQVKLEYAISKILKYLFIFLLPISMVIMFNSATILEILYGTSYSNYPNAGISLALLSFGYVFWGITYSFHNTLRSLGEKRFFLTIGISVITFEIIACWFLTLWLGLFGCAIVRVIYITILFLSAWKKITTYGVYPFKYSVHTLIRVFPLSIAISFLILVARPISLLQLVVFVSSGFLVYLISLILLRTFSNSDFVLVKQILPSFLHNTLDFMQRNFATNDNDLS